MKPSPAPFTALGIVILLGIELECASAGTVVLPTTAATNASPFGSGTLGALATDGVGTLIKLAVEFTAALPSRD